MSIHTVNSILGPEHHLVFPHVPSLLQKENKASYSHPNNLTSHKTQWKKKIKESCCCIARQWSTVRFLIHSQLQSSAVVCKTWKHETTLIAWWLRPLLLQLCTVPDRTRSNHCYTFQPSNFHQEKILLEEQQTHVISKENNASSTAY